MVVHADHDERGSRCDRRQLVQLRVADEQLVDDHHRGRRPREEPEKVGDGGRDGDRLDGPGALEEPAETGTDDRAACGDDDRNHVAKDRLAATAPHRGGGRNRRP
jgi:hypothetical protein